MGEQVIIHQDVMDYMVDHLHGVFPFFGNVFPQQGVHFLSGA